MQCSCASSRYSFFSLTEADELGWVLPRPLSCLHPLRACAGPPVVASVYDHGRDGICLGAGPRFSRRPSPTTPRCLCKCRSAGRKSLHGLSLSLSLSLSLTSIFLNPRWFIGRRQDGKRKSSCLLFSRVEVSSVLSTIVLGGCAERP